MDPPPPRTPSPHPDPDTSKPKRSGRPPLSNNKRTVQIRMAQRAYRERKENKIKELEDRVAFLTASSPAPCLSCADLRTRTEECLAQVAVLNQRVTELQQICGITPSVPAVTGSDINGIWYTQPQSLTNVSRATMSPVRSDSGFVTTTTTNTMIPRSCDSPVRQSTDVSFSAPMLRTSANLSHDQSLASFPSVSAVSIDNQVKKVVLSAQAKFGPMNMEPCRRALRDLGSLQTSAWVDVFIDNVIIQSQMTDPYEIKKHVIRLMHAKYKMLDSCTIMDRVKALEIIEDAKKEHRRHLNYAYGCARMVAGDGGKAVKLEPTEYNETEMLVESDPASFKESVRAIPSLQNPTAIQALNQLCDLYSIAAKSKSNEERENLLFHMMELKTLLHDMCANQTEKTNFILAIEVSREKPQNKRITGKFLEDLQYGLD